MAEPICRIVSNLFYDGRLIVAGDCCKGRTWTKERALQNHPSVGDDHTSVLNVQTDGIWSPKYHGPIRYESAEVINNLASQLCKDPYNERVLVLTPFRAQRTFIRAFLRRAGRKNVFVSTVHRAQGSEQQTVIFDPVDGNSKFLRGDEAERLVNVAVSRAKARFILLLSARDRENPLFSRMCEIIEQTKKERSAERSGLLADSTSSWIFGDYLVSITPYAIGVSRGGQELRGREGRRAVRTLLGAFMSDVMVHSLRHRTPSEIESVFSRMLPATVKWRRLASPGN
jgi:superfamily I DNA and/or RNA helicase